MISGKYPANPLPPSKGRVLLFSYAFPPMQVQMTPAVFKPMAAIARLGYAVGVVCADSFCPHLPLDNSLATYAENTFSNIFRLNPPSGLVGKLQRRSKILSNVPDLMTVLHRPAFKVDPVFRTVNRGGPV